MGISRDQRIVQIGLGPGVDAAGHAAGAQTIELRQSALDRVETEHIVDQPVVLLLLPGQHVPARRRIEPGVPVIGRQGAHRDTPIIKICDAFRMPVSLLRV